MHHYTECGLDNIWLVDGYKEIDTPYGKAVSVENERQLHRVIAMDIINCVPHFSGSNLRFIRSVMDVTQNELARLFGTSQQTIMRWEKSSRVPKIANQLIRVIYLNQAGEKPSYTGTVEKIMSMQGSSRRRMTYREKDHQQWEITSRT